MGAGKWGARLQRSSFLLSFLISLFPGRFFRLTGEHEDRCGGQSALRDFVCSVAASKFPLLNFHFKYAFESMLLFIPFHPFTLLHAASLG